MYVFVVASYPGPPASECTITTLSVRSARRFPSVILRRATTFHVPCAPSSAPLTALTPVPRCSPMPDFHFTSLHQRGSPLCRFSVGSTTRISAPRTRISSSPPPSCSQRHASPTRALPSVPRRTPPARPRRVHASCTASLNREHPLLHSTPPCTAPRSSTPGQYRT